MRQLPECLLPSKLSGLASGPEEEPLAGDPWGLQRLLCHLEQVAQECPHGGRKWGQASPSSFPASWRRPSLPQSAGLFSVCGRAGFTQ